MRCKCGMDILRNNTEIIVIDSPSVNFYVNVPAMNKEIKGCTSLECEKVIITVTKIKKEIPA